MKLELKAPQRKAVDKILNNEAYGLFRPMGFGKTLTILKAFTELQAKNAASRLLIIAPIKIAAISWTNEIKKWDDFKDLKVGVAAGQENRRRLILEDNSLDVVLFSCDSVPQLQTVNLNFDMLVIDESSKFKSPSSVRFKHLKKVLPSFERRYLLSGTPAPKSYMDLFSQIYVLDGGVRLGKTITAFRREFCDSVYRGTYTEYTLRESAKVEILDKIKDVCDWISPEDELDLPPIMFNDIMLSLRTPTQYAKLKKDRMLEVDGETIIADTGAGLAMKLRQVTSGFLYTEEGETKILSKYKADAVKDLVQILDGDPLIVAYNFDAELMIIRHKLKGYTPVINGQTSLEETKQLMADWNAGKIPVLAVQMQAAAHGLNIQYGGCNMCLFSLTWDLEVYLQLLARLHRTGQTRRVTIHRLLTENTIDTLIAERLDAKELDQNELFEAIRS